MVYAAKYIWNFLRRTERPKRSPPLGIPAQPVRVTHTSKYIRLLNARTRRDHVARSCPPSRNVVSYHTITSQILFYLAWCALLNDGPPPPKDWRSALS